MPSFRQLIVLAIVIGLVWLWRNWRSRATQAPGVKRVQFEDMVRCRYCGTHLTRNEAVGSDEHGYYCDDGHRLADQGRR